MKVKIVLTMLALLLFASTSLAYDKAVTYIRKSTFNKCSYKSVGQAVDEAFERPVWESGRSSDGDIIVNVTGVVTWSGKRYNVLMQFSPKPNGFHTNGIASNGKEMGPKFLNTFVTEVCK